MSHAIAIRRTWRLLDRSWRFSRGSRRAGAAGLDLGEDERVAVIRNQVELAEAGPVAESEDLEAEAFEVLGGEILASSFSPCHGRLSWPPKLCATATTALRVTVTFSPSKACF